MNFSKTAYTFKDQISLLKSRGLKIKDDLAATRHLSNISYYRLSSYFLSFQKYGDTNHTYMPWATFERVMRLYVFDRELRNILLDAIERIEVALRCRIVYEYSLKFSNNWYENPSLFFKKHSDFMRIVEREIKNSKETFIAHYSNKYTNPQNPPAWMVIEILSFGQVSTMYKNLKLNDQKKDIANYFGVSSNILESWLEHLVYIRNICAHHSRLWNRIMTVKATLPTYPLNQWISIPPSKPDKIYSTLCITSYLLDIVGYNNIFTGKVKVLLSRFNQIDIKAAGFPRNWKSDNFWEKVGLPITHRIRIVIFKCIHLIRAGKIIS